MRVYFPPVFISWSNNNYSGIEVSKIFFQNQIEREEERILFVTHRSRAQIVYWENLRNIAFKKIVARNQLLIIASKVYSLKKLAKICE